MATEEKSAKSSEMSPTFRKSVVSRPGSISPALTPFSGPSMELDEYRPSLADQVHVGFFSQDRSSQTEVSEIAQLKEMTTVLQNLVRDLDNLKRSLHYAKHVLQADYENKLQERALDLYCRVNDRILELEKQHEERVNVIRRSYRQQLADAISQISSQHQAFYARKSKQDKAMFQDKLKKVADDGDTKNKAKQQQDSIIEMMKMQMKDAQERADKQLDDAMNRPKSVSSVDTDPEIYDLREEVDKLEDKVEDLMNQLEDRENENRRLVTDVEDLNEQLRFERRQAQQLKKELSDALLAAEHERNNFKAELQKQKLQLQNDMEARLQETKNNLMAASQKQVEDLQRAHDQRAREQKLLDEKRKMTESMQTKSTLPAQTELSTVTTVRAQTEKVPVYDRGYLVSRLHRMEKPQMDESEKDELIRKLQKLEKKQTAENLRLQRELDRVNRTWEMKVTILQQTLHALKDESFLRTSLQRQAARLQHAAVVYASDGPAIVVTNTGDKNISARTYSTLAGLRPGRMETVPFNKPQRMGAESPFTEERPTPAPDERTPTPNEGNLLLQENENSSSRDMSSSVQPAASLSQVNAV